MTQIKPLLHEKCYACHGTLKQESQLRLETRELMLSGGDSGPAIVAGDPEASLLLQRITSSDHHERMPPIDQGSELMPEQVDLIRRWIRDGAPAPNESAPPPPNEHWAFQPITKPTVATSAYHDTPIDALLDAKREEAGVVKQPLADRSILIRRLYLDLVGLPPSVEQLHDDRPWSEIVDDLLSSPHHGERWARHWMDIWRYCDWYGLNGQLRVSQKHLWHWRDWIVNSLNEDKGYDQMVLEMLAGDECSPTDPEVLAATGYLARNYYLFNRTTWLDNTIEHTGKAFLGLTLNCAKCHDHKYDPITQEDYYRLRAIFEPHQVRLDPVPGETDFERDGLPRVFDDHIDLATYLHVRGDPKNPDRDRRIVPGVPAVLAAFAPEIEAVPLPVSAYMPGARLHVRRDRLNRAISRVEKARQQLSAAEQEFSLAANNPALNIADPIDKSQIYTLVDQFDQPRPGVWEIIGNGWQYRGGQLHQTVSSREKQKLRLRHKIPRDFELDCHYTTTGGDTYKSVTFRFDESTDGQYANYVYTSAHAPGPKVQVAFTRRGSSTYPAQGRRGQDIDVGQRYHMRFAVRDNLVNVWLDEELVVAYRLPDRRHGSLSLSGFDATVAFDSIEIRSLAAETELTEAENDVVTSPSDAEAAVNLARARLVAAEAELRSLEATIVADRANFDEPSKPHIANELANHATRLQAEATIASAQHEMLANSSDAKKRTAAKKRLVAAEESLKQIEKGNFEYKPLKGAKKALESPAHNEADYPATYPTVSSGRRLALARWITSRENPLTARVAVNHVWTRHFGSPLVESVFDFGLRSERPIHADLLDFLAAELIESGWSLRHLHRLIVNSEAYRLTSSSRGRDPATMSRDTANRYYWRANARRMESQVVRDCLLQLAGKLDREIGGPSIDTDSMSTRRSLYLKHSRDQQDKFLRTFDDADVLQCYRRSESIVPQQALALANSRLAISMAVDIERQVSATLENADRIRFIDAVIEWLLGRPATSNEIDECNAFFDDMHGILGNAQNRETQRRIRVRFVQAILNHNDFITIR